MRNLNLNLRFALLLLGTASSALAADFSDDGIYYNFTGTNTVEVTSTINGHGSYTGPVTIPSSVTYNGKTYSVTAIGDEAFGGCTSLTSVNIPNSVTEIRLQAFDGCTSLTSVNIPNSVTYIGHGAFCGCTSLTGATIPNSVTYIGNCSFAECVNLTSVNIPNSVTYIGQEAFLRCTGLTEITVNSGNSVYDSRNYCNAIIETASNTLIAGCQNTVIPNSVTAIGNFAFADWASLTSITIPNSVTYIGNCSFVRCSGLTGVNIPNSVTTIDEMAFYDCIGLTSVNIGNSVTSIGYNAFTYCTSLTSVTSLAVTPPQTADSFYSDPSIYDKATLYVPRESVGAYRTAYEWKKFKTIVGIDADPLPGDANGDGEVNIADITRVIDAIIDNEYSEALDVNGDGEINIADINKIIQAILNA